MFDINKWVTIDASLETGEPSPPKYSIDASDNMLDEQAWAQYFHDLEQYQYQKMLNDYESDTSFKITANIKFKGIG